MPSSSIIVICIAGCLTAGIGLLNFIRIAKANQVLAYSGDATAAKRIILPCYRPLFRGLVLFFVCFAVALGLSMLSSDESYGMHGIVIYYCFCSLAAYSILPVLLLQKSISIAAFWTTFYTISPWWSLCTLFWGLSFINSSASVPLLVLFLVFAGLVPMGLSLGILLKVVASRVQIGSTSNRNAVELLLLFSTIFGVAYSVDLANNRESVSRVVEYIMISVSFTANLIFPFALYRTLLADTKYWRGLGKHNKGMLVHEDLRESGVDIVRPTMDMSVVASSFQEMMTDVSNISIDFAYLELERLIGAGATSKVFSGKFKQKLVAIKLSTPAEITEDVIDVFVAEAKIAAVMSHINIVRFIGICVRPPQIAMVFEFCEGGNLKTNLQKHADKWTLLLRLRACSDCSKAVECLHQMGYIHRDLKAENFFVGHKNIVKLGDFGESTLVRNKESTANKRMTILGTVSFMAPEIIAASKHYTQSVDIYALAITFWEIWTGKEPYENVSQFDIYEKVGKGFRPQVPDNAPDRFKQLMSDCWQQDSAARPTASQVVAEMKEILTEYTHPKTKNGISSSAVGTDDDDSSRNSSIKEDTSEDSGTDGDVMVTQNPILSRKTSPKTANSHSSNDNKHKNGSSDNNSNDVNSNSGGVGGDVHSVEMTDIVSS